MDNIKIANFLKDIIVDDNYNWKIPFDRGFGKELFIEEDLQPFKGLSNFEQNILLKSLISKKISKAREINNIDELKKIFEWIVHDWGGIRNGRKNVDAIYEIAIEALANEDLPLNRIASTSKILSFCTPRNHIIYDARTAYSLNAIMLLENASDKYFPVPLGTNSKMNAFNIEVLIRLKYKPDIYKRGKNKKLISKADKELFIPDNQAYNTMKSLIVSINKEIYKNDSDRIECPFYTEMLLFSIADTFIYDQILEKITIQVK